MTNNITKSYKKTDETAHIEINQEAKDFAADISGTHG